MIWSPYARHGHAAFGWLGASAVAAIAVACGSSNPGDQGFVDAGSGSSSGGGAVDSGSPGPDTGTTGHDSGPVFQPDATPPLDAGLGGDASDDGAAGDGAFEFDGFAHADGYSEASYCPDDDGDGFTVCAGDCNDHDSLVNPCAFDTNAASGDAVGVDGVDNDCDGTADNRRVCDAALTAGHSATAGDYAKAIELCDDPRCPTVVSATFNTLSNANARRITAHMGNNFKPHVGSFMTFLSSGQADDDVDTAGYRPGQGTDYGAGGTNPAPLSAAQNPNACSATGANESLVPAHDLVELDLTLKAPVNAGSFTFDFNFFSEEYPRYVCAGYNDTFLAMLTSQQYPTATQISFDAQGHRVNVNNGFFADCPSVTNHSSGGGTFSHTCTGALSLLGGTGYEVTYSGNDNVGSGATDWLKTTAPIHPGETFTLKFYVFDEQDGILDSAVNLDDFRWSSTTVGSPVTGR